MLPMHWGTFDLTDEPLDWPPQELARVVAKRSGSDDRIRVLAVGERWKIPERPVLSLPIVPSNTETATEN